MTPSERAEIVIDFQDFNEKDDLALVNEDGSVLLPFDISQSNGKASDLSTQLNDFSVTAEERNLPVNKTVELFGMMEHVTINGKKFDPDRIDFTQEQGVTEVWEIYNKPDMMGGMIHPFHIHGAQFKIISRDGGAPLENEQGWKDSIAVHPDETVKIAIQFKNKGLYMFHCHILEHEGNDGTSVSGVIVECFAPFKMGKRVANFIKGAERMNVNYEECLQACLECLEACNRCYDACLGEEDVKMMADCIRLDRECADMCAYTAQAITRKSPFVKEIIELCATICERCAEECNKHDHEHCKQCAEACRKCAAICKKAVA